MLTTVSVFVNYNARVKTSITRRSRLDPDVHAHTAGDTIGWGCKVCVAEPGAVLCVEDHVVFVSAAVGAVIPLEVASGFGEAECIEEVVVGVCCVEELDDGGVDV